MLNFAYGVEHPFSKTLTSQFSLSRLCALLCVSVLLLCTPLSEAAAIDTQAREALLVDMATGNELLSKDPDTPMPPASMSKLMTLYMVFDKLKEGSLSLEDEFTVSEKAWRTGGSKMFVGLGSRIKIQDLLQGVIVQSGNDACVVLAEGIAGSEAAFAELMNAKAKELGMDGSHFTNATGLPDPNHYTTARDLVTLARHIIEEFPTYYGYFSQKEYTWNDIRQFNRNPLLYTADDLGVDGLKTGHTEEAGYGLVSSATRMDRRLVLIVTGLESKKQRGEESERLLRWAFREFENYRLFEKGAIVGQALVWKGKKRHLPLTSSENITASLKRTKRDDMEVSIVYTGPLKAPINAGDQVASLVVEAPDTPTMTFPLVAAENMEEASLFGKFLANLKFLAKSAIE